MIPTGIWLTLSRRGASLVDSAVALRSVVNSEADRNEPSVRALVDN